MSNKKQFTLSSVKKQQKEVDVVIHYNDDREDEVMKLKTPLAKDIIDIRRRITNLLKEGKSDDNKLDDVLINQVMETTALLCVIACVTAYNGADDPQLKALTEDEWLCYIHDTGGCWSDLSATATKLCGFNEISEATGKVKKALENESFNPDIDNPPV